MGEPFDAWCEQNMLPWVADHVAMDGDAVRRWEGGDVDLTRRLPSDLILAAAERDPGIGPATGGYLSMLRLPSCLDPVEPLARAVYAVRLAAGVHARPHPRGAAGGRRRGARGARCRRLAGARKVGLSMAFDVERLLRLWTDPLPADDAAAAGRSASCTRTR